MSQEEALAALAKHVAAGGRIILAFKTRCENGELISISPDSSCDSIQRGRVVREATYNEYLTAIPFPWGDPTKIPGPNDPVYCYFYEVESD